MSESTKGNTFQGIKLAQYISKECLPKNSNLDDLILTDIFWKISIKEGTKKLKNKNPDI
ncbi:MAG: hypothetical protein QM631_10210 [Dysgonomonas sp.]